jgi:hypothetical protein
LLPKKGISLLDITHVADGPKANIAVLQGGVLALLAYADICDLPLNFHPVTIRALTDVSLIGSPMIGWAGFDRMATNRCG